MRKHYLDAPFAIKALSEAGEFEGYGSVWGVVDAYGEEVMPGAFRASLARHAERGTQPALLWQHDTRQPIGVYSEMREDDTGLFVRGRLAMKTGRGAEAYELLKMRAVTGLSIGFMPKTREIDEDADIVRLTEVDLWETSIVTFPANDAARVSAVKFLSAGEMPDERMLERALRESLGMSKTQAKGLLARGYAGLARREADAENALDHVSSLATMVKRLR